MAFTAKNTGEDDGAYSAGDTFWMPCAGSSPTCALEDFALQIFQFHANRLELRSGNDYDELTSGAEWWTQCIPHDSEIGFHWDKDYTLEEDAGIEVFPHLGTVTYLTGHNSAPTIFLEHSPRFFMSESAASDDEPQGLQSDYTGTIKRAWLSAPTAGKHVCFDGKHLHGAPDNLSTLFKQNPTSQSSSVKLDESQNPAKKQRTNTPGSRVTFLVNIWFNWKPLGASRLPASFVKRMSTAQLTHRFSPKADPVVEGSTLPGDGKGAAESMSLVRRKFEQQDSTHAIEIQFEGSRRFEPGASVALTFDSPKGGSPMARVTLCSDDESESEEESDGSESDESSEPDD